MRSGCNFIRVDSVTETRRIAGSPIGVNVYLGILRLLNIFDDPTEAVVGAIRGDSTNIDLSVGDIYGGSYESLGLPANMIASSFGKLKNKESLDGVEKNDISRSLMTMLLVNTLTWCRQIMQLENIEYVTWIGTHIDILTYMQMTSDAFEYLSKGEKKIIFPTYASFLGSLGVMISQKNNE